MKMMKRLMLLMVVMVGGGGLTSIATAEVTPKRMQWVGVNPLGLVFHIYSGHYGRYLKDGAADITIPFFYWHPLDELTILGGGAKYHIYPDKDGTGVFYGGGVQAGYVSWDYKWFDSASIGRYKTENITGISFTPHGEAGYRWLFGKKKEWTIAPSISLGFTVGKIESSTGVEAEYGSSGLYWGLGLGLAYMFE
jgi:hypothetical protein